MSAVLSSVLLLLLAEPATSSTVPTSETAAAKAEGDRVICRRDRVVGSNMPMRVCKTKREWDELRDLARDSMSGGRGNCMNNGVRCGTTPAGPR